MKAKPITDGYRIAPDGVLERDIRQTGPCAAKWVPVVPDGRATRHLSWKRLVFLQVHVGIFGGHRNAEKTLAGPSTLSNRQGGVCLYCNGNTAHNCNVFHNAEG